MIKVDGLREFQFAVRRADADIPKRIGQAHKAIGDLVIQRLQPKPTAQAVGEGTGAAVRSSAAKREVLLRVGGKHRARHSPQQQWGKRQVGAVGTDRPERPYIMGTVERHRDEIGTAYLEAISQACNQAFHDTDP